MDSPTRTNAGNDCSSVPGQPASAISRFVEAGGLRLHYLDYGTVGRAPMLCIHGGGAHAHWFDFVVPGFVKDYHVLSLDLPGHGDSEWMRPPDYSYERFASVLAEVAEKLDLRDFVLVGHSMGGMISLAYAAAYPARVSRLIVVDSRPVLNQEFVERMSERGKRQSTSYASLENFAEHYRLRPAGSTAAPELLRYLASYAARQQSDGTWQHKFDRNVYAHRKLIDGLACWSRIKIPALLMRGALSSRITAEIFEEVRAHCAHVQLEDVDNSHHHVPVDNPAGFVKAARPFLPMHR